MTATALFSPQAVHGADVNDLQPDFAHRLSSMIAASSGRIFIVSGFRSREQQANLYAQNPRLAAPPGHSNHERGLAADLGGDIQLAHQLAPQFGLVFPMSWENWHIEPIGARDGASAQAYTQGPAGTVNPTEDSSWMSDPAKLAATFADALKNPGVALTSYPGTQTDTGTTTSGATQGGMTMPTGSGSVSPAQVYQALRAAGADPLHAAALTAIAGRESSYNTTAHNGNRATGDDSYGLFQINLLNGGWTRFLQQHGIANPASDLTTLEGSARGAVALLQSSGLQPWGGYKGMSWSHGVSQQYLQDAANASGGEVSIDQLIGLGSGASATTTRRMQ